MRSHSSTGASAIVPSSITPALLMTMSSRPSSPTAARTAALAWSRSLTSAWIARPPISPTSASSRSLRRATTATVAPSAASARAVASPMPLLAPVTSATVPSSLRPMRAALHLQLRGGGLAAERRLHRDALALADLEGHGHPARLADRRRLPGRAELEGGLAGRAGGERRLQTALALGELELERRLRRARVRGLRRLSRGGGGDVGRAPVGVLGAGCEQGARAARGAVLRDA